MMRLTWTLAVLALCVAVCLARPGKGGRGRGRGRGGNPADRACEVDFGNGTMITRTCGCDGETGVTCSLVSTRANSNRDGITYKFCYQEQDFLTVGTEWTGPFKKACRVVLADGTEYTRDCKCEGTCGTEIGLTGFQVNGQNADAYLCGPAGRGADGDAGTDDGDDETDPAGPEPLIVADGCVCLIERPPKRKMRRMTCGRTVGGEVELQRDCGCEGEIPATCDVTKSRTNADGQTVTTSFCYQPPTENNGQFTFTGVLAGACLIESDDGAVQYQTGPCPCGSVCSSDPATAMTGFSVSGRDARAFFCEKPDQDDTEDDDTSRRGPHSHDGDNDAGCVCLETPGATCTADDECPAGRPGGQGGDQEDGPAGRGGQGGGRGGQSGGRGGQGGGRGGQGGGRGGQGGERGGQGSGRGGQGGSGRGGRGGGRQPGRG